ncbi:hypothetical protein Goklo_012723, partial [Gossypium klotzschianum]|nr:hypothetical protein [Gossypium klotzschianum]
GEDFIRLVEKVRNSLCDLVSANRLVLKHLFTFRMNKCDLLKDHISQFITLLNSLKNVEVQIDDEDQAMLL